MSLDGEWRYTENGHEYKDIACTCRNGVRENIAHLELKVTRQLEKQKQMCIHQ